MFKGKLEKKQKQEIEEHFRGKKQEYDFENMRVRTLESMNNLNMMLTIHLGHIA